MTTYIDPKKSAATKRHVRQRFLRYVKAGGAYTIKTIEHADGTYSKHAYIGNKPIVGFTSRQPRPLPLGAGYREPRQ